MTRVRVLMLTQRLDAASPVLASAVGWVNALAARVDHVDVVCFDRGHAPLASNVTVWTVGTRERVSRIARLRSFVRHVAPLAGEVDVLFAHMVPRFAWLAFPLARARRRPIVLWYVHRQRSFELRLAAAASAVVATAVPASFPIASAKVRALGHGVDGAFFAPGPPDESPGGLSGRDRPEPPLVVMIGRLAPVKRQDILLRALALLRDSRKEVRLIVAGHATGARGRAYLRRLRDLAASLGVSERVTFAGAVSPEGVRALYRRAAVAVNLSPSGLFDKAPLESMMTGTPTIVASASFDPLLPDEEAWLRLRPPEGPLQLARSLERALAMDSHARVRLGQQLRLRALEAHGLDGLMDRLVAAMAAVRA